MTAQHMWNSGRSRRHAREARSRDVGLSNRNVAVIGEPSPAGSRHKHAPATFQPLIH